MHMYCLHPIRLLILLSLILESESRSIVSNRWVRPVVALTREAEKNVHLRRLLPNVSCVDIPCIEFAPGENTISREEIRNNNIVVITSPQGAKVFADTWIDLGKPNCCVASVGSGTSEILRQKGLEVTFEPTTPTAECLAQQLPMDLGPKVLCPTSDISRTVLEAGLRARGFEVTRLHTYCTRPATWTPNIHNNACAADIVTFASPSAVHVWADRMGTAFTAVAIGPTTEDALRKRRFKEVIAPKGSGSLNDFAFCINEVVRNYHLCTNY